MLAIPAWSILAEKSQVSWQTKMCVLKMFSGDTFSSSFAGKLIKLSVGQNETVRFASHYQSLKEAIYKSKYIKSHVQSPAF